ncbi:unnamed protein product [Phytophthora fragariaefolia]|uniref:Unnamed protein product n=1 Tax=Phytophthora fragariaefolia TaxID=1490495 RepID=A0A9W6Y081_9STRA|nr:unnamed protein product [Phytophthora fragariaefolia]
MRLDQVALVALVAEVCSGGALVTATFNEIASIESESFRSTAQVTRSLQEERRRSKASTAAAAGASGRATVPSSNAGAGGKTVTVTKYNNNGLVQRFKRWWKKWFSSGSSSSTRRLRQLENANNHQASATQMIDTRFRGGR